jgi:hypothetical protein
MHCNRSIFQRKQKERREKDVRSFATLEGIRYVPAASSVAHFAPYWKKQASHRYAFMIYDIPQPLFFSPWGHTQKLYKRCLDRVRSLSPWKCIRTFSHHSKERPYFNSIPCSQILISPSGHLCGQRRTLASFLGNREERSIRFS